MMNSLLSRISSSIVAVSAATLVLAGGGTLASIATGSVPAAFAQDQPTGAQAPQQRGRMGKVLMSLNLSDAQKGQIRAIIADARKQNQTITDRDAKRANMREAYKKINTTVLTPAQQSEFKTKMDAMRQQNADTHAQ